MENKDIAFWENYAKVYDSITPNFQKHLLSHIGKQSKGNVADFGCGVGKLFSYLSKNENVEKITAIDSSPQMLKYAKQKLDKYFPNNSTQIIEMELNQKNISQLNQKFDTINLINVLYANSNPIEVISQLSNKLNPNGYLCISDMQRKVNSEKLFSRLEKEFSNHPHYNQFIQDNQQLISTLIPKNYDLNELESIITNTTNLQTIEKSDKFYCNSSNYILLQKIN